MSDKSSDPWWMQWNPDNVTLSDTDVSDAWKTCVLQGVYFGGNDYNGWLGARISSVFVILVVSTFCTLYPVLAKHIKWMRINKWFYMFARNFGTGVIVATAFIHLMDPAYEEIGGLSCVGSTGHWADYSWCPAIMLATVFLTFLVDLFSAVFVEKKYGAVHEHNYDEIAQTIVRPNQPVHDYERSQVEQTSSQSAIANDIDAKIPNANTDTESVVDSIQADISFKSEFAAFLVLEFGVLFHSVMIGLNLGSTGKEFSTLYPVLVFHQSFEGLGIGARLSAIEFPQNKRWWPYALCVIYGLTTPICVAIGLGIRTTYNSSSYTVNVVSGVLDAISAGVLLYTGMVELLARDWIFNAHRTKEIKEILFGINSMLWGAGLMALLGKWA
ncbi:hypothetical protein HG537_0G04930 [Torulaspora globosa]|uniref:Uncharacterized protein n=1 Tax=Torulaspora globosa TaxID=48254 RepID=A0A7H9HWY5_9SACH|nr:hypothetical protein HG537_0G04930 [Torulaspora sp. CBS 2947]